MSTHPFPAKKSLGQNFLTNPHVAETIAKSMGMVKGETVLEIGPGTGMLTRALLKEGARVVAIEADHRAVAVLAETFAVEIADGTLILIHDDIRTIDLTTLALTANKEKSYSVAANIPYYLSGMLFQLLLERAGPPKTLVFMVQKEVAVRIARSKKESLLSLSIKAYGVPSYIGTVSRGNFSPQPGVDSAILKIASISKDKFIELDEKHFFTILKTGFKARRKHLLGNLSNLASREMLEGIFERLQIPKNVRGEDISIETWVELARLIPSVPITEIK